VSIQTSYSNVSKNLFSLSLSLSLLLPSLAQIYTIAIYIICVACYYFFFFSFSLAGIFYSIMRYTIAAWVTLKECPISWLHY